MPPPWFCDLGFVSVFVSAEYKMVRLEIARQQGLFLNSKKTSTVFRWYDRTTRQTGSEELSRFMEGMRVRWDQILIALLTGFREIEDWIQSVKRKMCLRM